MHDTKAFDLLRAIVVENFDPSVLRSVTCLPSFVT